MLGYGWLDDKFRQAAAANEAAANASRIQDIKDRLAKRTSGDAPDFEGIGAALASHMGGDPKQRARAYQNLGPEGRVAYADIAARQSQAGIVAGTHGLFARDDLAGKVARGSVVGVSGGLGLTAAGQGLMALMEYLQQGQQTNNSREQELA